MLRYEAPCNDIPCEFGRVVCCFQCERFRNCSGRCDQLDCEGRKEIRKMKVKERASEAGKMLLFGAVVNLPFWLYIAGVL